MYNDNNDFGMGIVVGILLAILIFGFIFFLNNLVDNKVLILNYCKDNNFTSFVNNDFGLDFHDIQCMKESKMNEFEYITVYSKEFDVEDIR